MFQCPVDFRGKRIDIPQRLQSVCDLLWRLPKDEVPFAVEIVSYCMLQNLDVPLEVGPKFRSVVGWLDNVLIVG